MAISIAAARFALFSGFLQSNGAQNERGIFCAFLAAVINLFNWKVFMHLALIPDGNRRWAKQRGLPPVAGHQQVVETTLPALVRKALELKIDYFTIWGFSTENWDRSQQEVAGLMKLMELFFDRYAQKLDQQQVRINFIGRRDNLDPKLVAQFEKWEQKTCQHQRLVLTIAFNYGGHDELLRAVNQLIATGQHTIDGAQLAAALDTGKLDLPDPDFIIRTSGEERLSGFMSWQAAYSELYFSDKLMPDWTGDDLVAALADFQRRQRRYGK